MSTPFPKEVAARALARARGEEYQERLEEESSRLRREGTCFDCEHPIFSRSTAHSSSEDYNLDGSRHRCFPALEIINDRRLIRLLAIGERLVPTKSVKRMLRIDAKTEKDWKPTHVSYEGELGGVLLHYYRDRRFLYQAPISVSDFMVGRWRRTGEMSPLPEPKPEWNNARNGWVSPRGEIFPCGFQGHLGLASRLEQHFGVYDLTAAGWMKVQEGDVVWIYSKAVTPPQLAIARELREWERLERLPLVEPETIAEVVGGILEKERIASRRSPGR